MRQEFARPEDGGAELRRLGAQLRALREAQGMTYEDVTSVTHMRPHIVKSIEDGSIERTMAPIYSRGFIKTYCMYLMASDLWRKYSMGIPTTDDGDESEEPEEEESVEIKHPTAVFRRSSIIWVYMILVMAILGAVYLLWRQHQASGGLAGPFPLTGGSNDRIAEFISYDAPDETSGDEALSGDAASEEILPIPVPRSADSPVSGGHQIATGDISWINETSASERLTQDASQFVDKTLLIEITGSQTLLTVEQGGKRLTRRTLGIGQTRSYEVSADTKVTVSSGNKARVTWFGKKYESVGADKSQIVLIFHPDGQVTLEKGKSTYFVKPETP
jgi:cytoskeletal protein RodZ